MLGILWIIIAVLLAFITWKFSVEAHSLRTALVLICCISGYLATVIAKYLSRPVRIVIWMSLGILSAGYLFKYAAFLAFGGETYGKVSNVLIANTVFTPWSLQADPNIVTEILIVTSAGFMGILGAALFCMATIRNRHQLPSSPRKRSIKPLILTSLMVIVVTGIPRWTLHLYDYTNPIRLPFELRGVINLLNAYVGPYLLAVGMTYAMLMNRIREARRIALLLLIIGMIQFLLFLSKWSMVSPLMFIIIAQLLTKRILFRRFETFMAIACLLVVYPFLNIFRSLTLSGATTLPFSYTLQLGVVRYGDFASALVAGPLSLWGRIVGFDNLVPLIENRRGMEIGITEVLRLYLSSYDLDNYLTYDVIGFTVPQGVSPGFLGRSYYLFHNPIATAAAVLVSVFLIAWLANRLWNTSRLEGRALTVVWLGGGAFQLLMTGMRFKPIIWQISILIAVWMMTILLTRVHITISESYAKRCEGKI